MKVTPKFATLLTFKSTTHNNSMGYRYKFCPQNTLERIVQNSIKRSIDKKSTLTSEFSCVCGIQRSSKCNFQCIDASLEQFRKHSQDHLD